MDGDKKRFPWLAASVMAGGALALFNWLGGKGTGDAWFDLGQALGGAIIVWAVLLLVGLRRSGAGGMVGGLGVLWFLAFGGLLASAPQLTAPAGTTERLTDQLTRVMEQSNSDSLEMVDELQVGTPTRDAKGQAEVFAAKTLNAMIAVQNEYIAEMQVIGWDKVLDADRLRADADLSESMRMMEQARGAANRLCREQRSRFEAAGRQAAEELDMTPREKQQLLESFLRGVESSAGDRDEICRLELAILDEFGGLLAVFGSDPGWVLKDGMFLFTEDRHVERFNHHFQNIQTMTEQQEALRKAAMSEGQAQLRKAGL